MAKKTSAKSHLEEELAFLLRSVGEGDFEREVRFHPSRRWRADFCFREERLLIEVQGGGRNGRHMRYTGYKGDCEKMCEAALQGWTVLYVLGEHVKSGQALYWIQGVLKKKRGESGREEG